MTVLEQVPEVEVSAKATRRRFSAKEKLRILGLADACTKVGELGAMLRREGIYSSSLAFLSVSVDVSFLLVKAAAHDQPVPGLSRRHPLPHVADEVVDALGVLALGEAGYRARVGVLRLMSPAAKQVGQAAVEARAVPWRFVAPGVRPRLRPAARGPAPLRRRRKTLTPASAVRLGLGEGDAAHGAVRLGLALCRAPVQCERELVFARRRRRVSSTPPPFT